MQFEGFRGVCIRQVIDVVYVFLYFGIFGDDVVFVEVEVVLEYVFFKLDFIEGVKQFFVIVVCYTVIILDFVKYVADIGLVYFL